MRAYSAAALCLLAATPIFPQSSTTSQTAPIHYQPALDDAFMHLYSSDFEGSQRILDTYIGQHPADPLPFAVKASGYVFSELHRLGILEADFFQNDKAIIDKKKHLQPDPQIRTLFYKASNQAQTMSQQVLSKNPNDTNALFALCLTAGDLTDYTALIEKKQMQSLSINRDGYRDAKKLLQVAPNYYDAYLTTGFTDYIIGSIPLIFRWFVRFDDVEGSKTEGIERLEIVATKGHYLKPFAKILLATVYLREKRLDKTKELLVELTQAYPQNALLKRELDHLSARM